MIWTITFFIAAIRLPINQDFMQVIFLDFLANPLLWIVIFLVIGILAGTIVGVMGGSGVAVVVPLLVLLGTDVHTSIGTSLFVDVVASVIAVYTYRKNGNVDMTHGIWMAIAAVGGAQVGSLFAASTPAMGMNWGFGIFLIINGIVMLKTGLKTMAEKVSSYTKPILYGQDGLDSPAGNRRAVILSIVFGFGIGVISGFFGAGGGMMFLFVLILILGYELHVAVGTSTLIMAITAVSGTVGYAVHGYLDIIAAIIIGLGSIISVRFGAIAANKLGEKALGKVIAGILIALGVMMVVFSLHA
ncbi:MAG TPA: sulfite exporter TauE/SafE family protein [Candidatus Lokiarchaeia archaeon]|nr:sulfite exporter TauE/SafE family protein [Candidatus Lokiarchaeia archaeon]